MMNKKLAGKAFLGVYVLLGTGALVWLAYGLYAGNYAAAKTVSVAATVVLAFIILLSKVKEMRR